MCNVADAKTFIMLKPSPSTYPAYFQKYVDQVEDAELSVACQNQQPVLEHFLDSITEVQSMHRYAEGKWSIKEILQHIIDAERIFCYRALCIARGDKTPLPSFDENAYAQYMNADNRSWKSLSKEMLHVRQSSIDLFQSFNEIMLQGEGTASGKSITPISLGFIMVGHLTHHINVVKERYLV
jgi:uncharacterized damage-inducible protein DinB